MSTTRLWPPSACTCTGGVIIEVVYSDPQGRVAFTAGSLRRNYFKVEGINYEMNTDQNQWRTSYAGPAGRFVSSLSIGSTFVQQAGIIVGTSEFNL
jgi:hypothetical protein